VKGVLAWRDFAAMKYSHGGYPLTRHLSQRLGAGIAFVGYRLGLSASFLTVMGAALGLAASTIYATGDLGWPTSIGLMVAFQLAYGFDCADGQLARATQTTSEFGGWLDLATDYIRYIAVAVLWVLLRHAAPAVAAVAGVAILLTGTVILLHTTGYLQKLPDRDAVVSQAPAALTVFRTFLDTPTFLLLLCLFRNSGGLLLAYALVIGTCYTLVSLVLAARRLPRPA
jgi:phosphatidylglycerophosphate synthase